MTEKIIVNLQGLEVERLTIPSLLLEVPNNSLIYEAVKNENANRRVGTSSTKTRAEVNASNRKPWAQKGLGRARAGDRKSPIWRGGGIVFGPKPRPWSYQLPKKVKRGAFISLLSIRLMDDSFIILDSFGEAEGRTKDFVVNFQNFLKDHVSTLLIGGRTANDGLFRRATRNVPFVNFHSFDNLSAVTLFYSKKIIISKANFLELCDRLQKLSEGVAL